MMASANEYPLESVIELQPLREAIAECIEKLSDEDRFIIDAVNSEIVSLQELGDRLGVSKPHAWRLRNAAYERLKIVMLENTIIRERLGLDENETDHSGF
jgi:DNA-directed RNA polymerase specialized sigma subunit